MKTCQNCHELNGDNRTTCWKCSAPFPVSVYGQNYKKICPNCGMVYASNVENCSSCHVRLGVYDDRAYAASGSESSGCWMYVVAVLIPLVGIILGLIYIAKGDEELGKSLILTGVVAWIIIPLIALAFGSCGLFFG